ncbi:heavy-metal-associated domain-containing protein [Chitinilyticum litopenaei]|uniref:heavy-metal-associated domain-containing protein n=1 Tax=Chitinilyticum litopenaei TaxID=1121276 RepID=UPI0003FEE685|nr:heavy-metal-associated domain-containing protein [Chitinilyticum litopenaei]
MYTLEVANIGCASCEGKIRRALLELDTDARIALDRAARLLTVETAETEARLC